MSEKTHVSRITIGRLHNLGNYEHVRYEISVDVAPSNDPSLVLRRVETILTNLRVDSGVSKWDLERAKERLAKPDLELTKSERSNREFDLAKAKFENARLRMERAREALTALGGTSVYTDAKLDWDDDDYWQEIGDR